MSNAAQKYGEFLDTLSFNRRHWIVFAVCAVTFAFDSLDFQIMALVAPAMAKEWGLKPQELGFVLSSTAAGMLVGAYLFGILGDRFGRLAGFQVTVAIFSVFSALCALAENPTQLAILRFITGIGIGGFLPIDAAMLTEYMPARRRGQSLAIASVFFAVGGLLAALAARFVVPDYGWRALFVVGVIPAIMVFLVRLLIPESPRFLLTQGRVDEARKSMTWIADGKPLPEIPATIVPPAQTSKMSIIASVGELFSVRYRARTAMLTGLWAFYSFSFYGLLLWMPSLLTQHKGVPAADVFTYMMGFVVSAMVGRTVMSFLVDSWGRTNTIALCGFGAAVAALVFSQQTTYMQLVFFGYALAFFHDGGYAGIGPYAPELYPTRVRATGIAWANGAGRIAGFIAPIAIGYLVPIGIWAVFAVLAAGYALGAVIVLAFRIETKRMFLNDAALEASPEEQASTVSTQKATARAQ